MGEVAQPFLALSPGLVTLDKSLFIQRQIISCQLLAAVENLGDKQIPSSDRLPLYLGAGTQWCKSRVSDPSRLRKEIQEFKARQGDIASSRLAQAI